MTTNRTLVVLAVLLVGALAAPVAAAASQPGDTAQRASLEIQQPHYIDSDVQVTRGANHTTYHVKGSYFEILPENFDSDDVINYGVMQEGATLSYDKTTGEYVLNTGGQSGTFTLYWVASQTTANENATNTTSTSRVRYEARVQTETGELAHIPQSNVNQLREDAANWSEVTESFGDVGGDAPVEEKLATALNWYQFSVNPFSALSGDFSGAVLILLLTNGGRLLLGLLILVPIATTAPVILKYRKLRERTPELAELDTEKLKIWRDKRKQSLVEVTPHDLPLNGRTADNLEHTLGENLWEIADSLQRLFDHSKLKRVYLQAMAQRGDTAAVARTTAGDIEEVTLNPSEDSDADAQALTDYDDEDFASIVSAADWGAVDASALQADIDLTELDTPISPTDVDDDIVAELDVSFPEDFESREQFAECLYEVWKHIAKHGYTTNDGYIKQERSLLNLFAVLSSVTAERYDYPVARNWRDLTQFMASEIDGNEQLREAAREDGISDGLLNGDHSGAGSGGD